MKLDAGSLVLLADDDLDTLEAMAFLLHTAGFRVETATNGREAEEIASLALPDVIVMDFAMPEVDGWEATRRIKSNEATRHVPIIACTAQASAETKEAAQQAGCDGYLAKPVDPALLITEISRVMELARQVQSLRSGRPYELVLYARSNSSDYPLLRRLVDRLRGEFDTSLVRIALREPAVASTEVPAMGVAQQQAILVHLEESPPLRISCDTADVELLLQRLRETGLPRRRID